MFELKPTMNMKRSLLAIIYICCTLGAAAQNAIRVNHQGARPTISDFLSAYFSARDDDEEECETDESTNAAAYAWEQHRKSLPQDENVTLTIDERNGYVVYECRQDNNLLKVEACYWNEADGKHKLFAYNIACFTDGKYDPGQYDRLEFWRYNNAAKTMTFCEDTGVDMVYRTDDNVRGSYALPRTGKDITVTLWYKSGPKQKTLKWNGRRFAH